MARLVGRPEHVEAIFRRAEHHPGHLRVPVQLLHIPLPLVHEPELRRQVRQVLPPNGDLLRLGVGFERHVPHRELVVRAGDGKGRVLVGVPLERGDGRLVPLERGHRGAGAERAQVPDLNRPIVPPGDEEVGHAAVPRDHVRVTLVRLHADRGAGALAQIPDGHAAVCGARAEDGGLHGAPPDVLHRARVPLVWFLVRSPLPVRRGAVHEDLARRVARGQLAHGRLGEVDREALLRVPDEGEEWAHLLWLAALRTRLRGALAEAERVVE
mmetsp:Transcript_5880/g.15385  ORF Transcript_5880/g.15385 Transcript_5880/m.15385 type:complete len:269 (-) Transcript_5880:725-1531(-)